MARRRTKKRTHVGASNGPPNKQVSNPSRASPKTMVIRIGAGEVGPSVSQLVKDVRLMMQPDTAARLKERRANRLRDYITMAGPLGVTHLLLFSRSTSGNTNLRMALTPRGPTLHFKVEKYSLCKDVKKAMKRPKGSGKEYHAPPLLVMNNFISKPDDSSENPQKIPKHLESLTTTMFQSLFPAINPQKTPLHSIRRVMLLNREPASDNPEEDGSYVINLRHYAITTKTTGLSKPLRRLNAAEKLLSAKPSDRRRKGGLPNLGKMEDIADYMIGGPEGEGYITDNTSGSEVDTDAEVEVLESVTRKVLSQKARQKVRDAASEGKTSGKSSEPNVEKRAVKLVELGPRMRLRMTKVEEGVCDGKVMWHEFIHKSKEEIKAQEATWEKRKQEKELRKKIQRENVEKKRKARGPPKEGEEDEDDEMEEWDSELDGDVEMGEGGEDEEEEGDEEEGGAEAGGVVWEDEEMAAAARKLLANTEEE